MDLVTRELRLDRGPRTLVESLSVELRPGQRWAVMGPNGAGKSTLLFALAGLFSAKSGTVSCDGESIDRMSSRDRAARIGWQGSSAPGDFGLTVRERIELAAPSKQANGSLLAKHELDSMSGRSLSDLSQGERQRVELAALESRDVPIWLLDEPTAHLDIRHQIRLFAQLQKESESGRIVVAAIHDLSQAAAFATHVILLDGRGQANSGAAIEMLEPIRLEHIFDARIRAYRNPQGAVEALTPSYEGMP